MSAAKSELDVLVLGHSHAYWLGAFIESAGLLDDLERLGYTCTVRFMGWREASIKTFREPATITRISAPAKVFRQDGVHLSDIGNFRLFRSIRGGGGNFQSS